MIEKSPPNMMRLEAMSAHFPEHSFLANNRDPYANCASILYKRFDAVGMDHASRIGVLRDLAHAWLKRSRRIRELVESLDIPLLTYEEFCRAPSVLATRLQLPDAVLSTIDCGATVTVKDYEPQKIVSHNDRQVANLSEAERDAIRDVLESDRGMLRFFGY